jgi:hypothetical protein
LDDGGGDVCDDGDAHLGVMDEHAIYPSDVMQNAKVPRNDLVPLGVRRAQSDAMVPMDGLEPLDVMQDAKRLMMTSGFPYCCCLMNGFLRQMNFRVNCLRMNDFLHRTNFRVNLPYFLS